MRLCVFIGVLLPGQELSFPFVFKSSNAGIFTETWALQTVPVLACGEVIRITLRGVASQEDVNEHKREDLEVSCVHTFFYISFSGDDGSPTVWGRYGAFLCYIFCICDYIPFWPDLLLNFFATYISSVCVVYALAPPFLRHVQRELNHRVAVVAAKRLINQIVNSIATPPHSSPHLLRIIPVSYTQTDTYRHSCLLYSTHRKRMCSRTKTLMYVNHI